MSTPRTVPSTRSQRGLVIIPLLMVTILIGGLTLVLLEESVGEVRRVSFAEERLRALEIAEIGLLRAEMELRGGSDADGDGLGTIAGTVDGGDFEVQATLLDANDRRYMLEARGAKGMAVRRIEVGVRILPDTYFTHALFAKRSLKLTGHCWSDSFDSRLGMYDDQASNWHPTLRRDIADIGGNLGSNGSIRISGHGGILGDAIPGPSDVTRTSGGAFVTGDVAPRSEDLEILDPPYEAFLAAFNENDNLSIDTSSRNVSYDAGKLALKAKSGTSVTLSGGTYIFHTVDIAGSGDITVTGPSVIYITDKFELGTGSLRITSGEALDCVVYGHAYDFPAGAKHRKQTVRIGSKSRTMLAVYAPTFKYISHGGGDLFGAVVADTVTLTGGAGLHYDRALSAIKRGTAGTERLYWRER